MQTTALKFGIRRYDSSFGDGTIAEFWQALTVEASTRFANYRLGFVYAGFDTVLGCTASSVEPAV